MIRHAMALKQWMKKCQPLSLYIVLTLTMFYFLVQLVVSYITHALTLTIDSYLMLCNLIALFGCIITLKTNDDDISDSCSSAPSNAETNSKSDTSDKGLKDQYVQCSDQKTSSFSMSKQKASEKRLKNTFGWARIDVLVMLIGCVVFSSLCFSNVIEAMQTLLHISHHDEMHYPIPVFCIGACGLLLNGLCYLLIGGYTFHHGSCLRLTSSGVVILDDVLQANGQRRLNLRSQCKTQSTPGVREMCRDVIGCIFVMIGTAIVYFAEGEVAKYADPVCSIISAIFLVALSFPYMKESCYILLQTIPNHINIDSLCREAVKEFPEILNIHDLHVWQFTKEKIFFTAHIIFINPQVYVKIKKKIMDFFHGQGITVVTIQPEFFKDSNKIEMISSTEGNCLIKCLSRDCYQRYCCDLIDTEELESICISKLQETPCQKKVGDCPPTSKLQSEDEECNDSKNDVAESIQSTKTNVEDAGNEQSTQGVKAECITECSTSNEVERGNVDLNTEFVKPSLQTDI